MHNMDRSGSVNQSPSSSGCHVGSLRRLAFLLLSLIAYLNVGATVFSYTEQTHARKRKDEFKLYVGEFRERHIYYGEALNSSELETLISRLEESILSGAHDNATRDRWDFIGSLVFSATVITTIGYGHSSPQTRLGLNLCVIYALVGIPLMAYTLAEIGSICRPYAILLARKLYSLIINVIRNKGVTWVATWCTILFGVYGLVIGVPALGIAYMEDWSYDDAYYFCFISLSTIGFGDKVAGSSRSGNYSNNTVYVLYSLGIVVYLLFGLSVIAVLINLIQSGDRILLDSEVTLYIRGDYDTST